MTADSVKLVEVGIPEDILMSCYESKVEQL